MTSLSQTELLTAANLAVLGMTEEEKAVFVNMFEAGEALSYLVAKNGFSRAVSRQIEMANMALSDSMAMDDLVDLVAERV